ncbi:MAG: hypothetical protein L0Z73_00180 [Gammaproteobacteria bacterium]|nr:hypothetical protein [Gammaproteobacteria bacterium]
MSNKTMRSIDVELTQRDTRYILHALNELMLNLEAEIAKDPEGEEDITPMYADDVLNLRDIHKRLKEKAVPVFGEEGLSVSYETL